MALRKGLLTVGLLALLASPTWAQFGRDGAAGWSGGIRAGALLSVTEFEDEIGPTIWGYVRRGVAENLEVELSGGYGKYKGSGDIADWTAERLLPQVDTMGDAYSTDMALGEVRLLFSPFDYEKWNPYFYAGVGFVRYDLDEQFLRTNDVEPISSGMLVPVGAGAQYKLSDSMALELSGGYTYTMLDDLNGAILDKGNDAYWTGLLGLTMGDFSAEPARPVKPTPTPMPKPEAPADQDGDGLTDQDEKTVYFTNPLMADSDGDGLSDGDEIKVFRTDPNKADSDGGSVGDGDEVGRGTDPLDAGDDVAEIEERAVEMPDLTEFSLPTVNFPLGGAVISAEEQRELSNTAMVLNQNPGILVELQGYTDNVGYIADNLRLSEKRAKAVKKYLVEQGVAGWRITVKAVGDEQPIAPNDTPEGRAKNRRVELIPR